jgi:hypothetical protein
LADDGQINYIKYIFKAILCDGVGIIKLRFIVECSLDSSNHDFSKLHSVRAHVPKIKAVSMSGTEFS